MQSARPLEATFAPGTMDPVVRQACLAGVLCTLLAPLALCMDLPASQFFLADRFPGDLRRVLGWSEVFGHGMGVALIAAVVLFLDPTARRRLPRLLVAAYGAGLAADIVKMFVARMRPRHFAGHDVLDSFAGWLPLLNPIEGVGSFGYSLQSFPSAHAAVAMGLAVGLAHLYPRGKYLFIAFAVLAAAQRVEAGAHYLSDALAGAAVGLLFGAAISGSKLFGKWFDRLEADVARQDTRTGSALAGH